MLKALAEGIAIDAATKRILSLIFEFKFNKVFDEWDFKILSEELWILLSKIILVAITSLL